MIRFYAAVFAGTLFNCELNNLPEAIAMALAAVAADTRELSLPETHSGPVIVDFLPQRSTKSWTPVDEAEVLGLIGLGAREGSYSKDIRCEDAPKGCLVTDNGAFARVDSIVSDQGALNVFALSIVSTTRPSGAIGTCTRLYEIRLTRGQGAWTAEPPRLLRTC